MASDSAFGELMGASLPPLTLRPPGAGSGCLAAGEIGGVDDVDGVAERDDVFTTSGLGRCCCLRDGDTAGNVVTLFPRGRLHPVVDVGGDACSRLVGLDWTSGRDISSSPFSGTGTAGGRRWSGSPSPRCRRSSRSFRI